MGAALSTQVGGDHYLSKGIQPVEFIAANNWDFFSGNILKYLSRWRDKGGLTDLRKCRHYADLRSALKMEIIPRHIDGRPAIWMNDYIRENKIEAALDPVMLALELWVMSATAASRATFLDLLDQYVEDAHAEYSAESL